MKKTFINTTFIIFAFALLLFSPFYIEVALAQPTPTPTSATTAEDPYTLLAPIPCVGGNCSGDLATNTTLPQYVKGFIQLSIGISAVFAIVMIVIGGFQYMTSDALQGKQDGKTRIKNSAIGILLIAASFIILQTINPDLLDIKLKIDASPTAQSGTQTGTLVAGGTCTTCVPLDSSLSSVLKRGQGTQILPDTNTKLVALNNTLKEENISWWISEAYPPTVKHANVCHSAGTCIDANFTNTSKPRTSDFESLTEPERTQHAKNINSFIDSAESANLRAIYEVPTSARRDLLIQAGVPANRIITVIKSDGAPIEPHFSVYNCSAHPESCRTLPRP